MGRDWLNGAYGCAHIALLGGEAAEYGDADKPVRSECE